MTREIRERDTCYKPTQASEHFTPYVHYTPDWFIDLGPASATEFLAARQAWPRVKLLGLEPSPVGFQYAQERWPADGILLQAAAWDTDGTLTLHQANDLLHGICYPGWNEAMNDDPTGISADMLTVPCRSLDSLDREYGPFREAVIWADIEGSERRALKGAIGLFERKAICAVNLEMRPAYTKEVDAFMTQYGFDKVRCYLVCDTFWDEIWVRAR